MGLDFSRCTGEVHPGEVHPGVGTMAKCILVTGGNSGIGLALCKLLATSTQPESQFPTPAPPPCYVYMGARDPAKGAAALKSITDAFPAAADKIEVLEIDVADDASCAAAAETLKARLAAKGA